VPAGGRHRAPSAVGAAAPPCVLRPHRRPPGAALRSR